MILCVPLPKIAIVIAREDEREEEKRVKRIEASSLEGHPEKVDGLNSRFPRKMHVAWRAVVWFVDRHAFVKNGVIPPFRRFLVLKGGGILSKEICSAIFLYFSPREVYYLPLTGTASRPSLVPLEAGSVLLAAAALA